MKSVANCTEDEIAAAMLQFLLITLERGEDVLPLQVGGFEWASNRQETKAAFAERFPRMMGPLMPRKGQPKPVKKTEA